MLEVFRRAEVTPRISTDREVAELEFILEESEEVQYGQA